MRSMRSQRSSGPVGAGSVTVPLLDDWPGTTGFQRPKDWSDGLRLRLRVDLTKDGGGCGDRPLIVFKLAASPFGCTGLLLDELSGQCAKGVDFLFLESGFGLFPHPLERQLVLAKGERVLAEVKVDPLPAGRRLNPDGGKISRVVADLHPAGAAPDDGTKPRRPISEPFEVN